MGSFLCKIWMFFLKAVDAIVDGLGQVLKAIIGVLGEVLSAIWDALSDVADSILGGGLGSVLLLAAAGFGLWWLMGRKREDDSDVNVNYSS